MGSERSALQLGAVCVGDQLSFAPSKFWSGKGCVEAQKVPW